jgi:hypothetical protein
MKNQQVESESAEGQRQQIWQPKKLWLLGRVSTSVFSQNDGKLWNWAKG